MDPTRMLEVRRFANTVGTVLSLLAAWLWFGRHSTRAPPLGFLGGLLLVLGALVPGLLDPLESLWMRFAHGLGAINTRILLGLVFYGIVLPMGLAMRALGADRCGTRKDSRLPSYFEPAPERLKDRKHFERPF